MKGNCNKSLKLLFRRGIEDLHDDDFEGSKDEDSIFREVFFGHETNKSSKKCLVTGAINFESEIKKPKDISVGCNSDNSVMTSHIESQNMKGSEEPTILARNDPDVEVKRRKMLLEEQVNAKPYIEKVVNSSIPSKEIDSCLIQPTAVVTCRLFESSCQGFKSSCYLLKGAVIEVVGKDAIKSRLLSFDTNDQKGNEISAAIASPVSQESHASKLLVTPTPTEPVHCSKRKWKDSCIKEHDPFHGFKRKWKDSSFVELDEDELLVPPKESTTDLRPLLRFHINRLLRAAKWVIGRRIRTTHCRGRGEFVFKTPSGRPIREFHRAWNMCGQRLVADANYVIGESDGIEWTSLSEFQSDLCNTLIEIEEQLSNLEGATGLAHWWYLLDPFAKVAFIDKSLRFLKEGKPVKTKRSVVDGFYSSDDAILPSKNEAITGNQITKSLRKENSDLVLFSCQTNNMYGSTGGSESICIHQDGTELGLNTKEHNNFKRLSEMKLSACSGMQEISESSVQLKSNMAESDGSCIKSTLSSSTEQIEKKQPRSRKSIHHPKHDKERKGRCHLNDDDLLLSAILKNRSTNKSSGIKKKSRVPKAPRKYNEGRKGSCRLRPRSLAKGGPHHVEGRWSGLGVRSVLSMLIDFGVIRVNEVIQFRNTRDDLVVKDGLVTRDGIMCQCCEKLLSVSQFKNHAGFSLKGPCLNLFMESGKPFTLCQLEAWSTEYKVRRGATRTIEVEDLDEHDDSCGLCGDGGELICCDNCPSTFHLKCLCVEELPEGNWYCSNCSCWNCGNVVNNNEPSRLGALKCLQCEHKYHEDCMRVKGMDSELVSSATWCCGESCKEVHTGLHSQIGIMNPISDGFSWTLLKCIHGDQKVHSAPRLVALKAECNLKLAVALTIMEECFLPMVDPRTGIDMIPHVMYNWGSEFARLNYEGFYTLILEKDDVIICVATVRIHGTKVAEMPLIATCSKYRRQGMCRRLMDALEEMLKSLKIEKLVVSAIPSLVDTWTKGFGFMPLEADEKKSLTRTNLMVFPGTVWLTKPMYEDAIQGTPAEAVDTSIEGNIIPISSQEDGDQNLKLSFEELPSLPSKAEGSPSAIGFEADLIKTEGTLISQQPYNYSATDTSLEDKSVPVSLQEGGDQDPKLSLAELPSLPSKAEGSSSAIGFEADLIKTGGTLISQQPYNYSVTDTFLEDKSMPVSLQEGGDEDPKLSLEELPSLPSKAEESSSVMGLEADTMITEGTLISQQPYNYSGIDTSLEDKSMPVSLQDGGQDPKLSLEEPPSPPSKAEGSSMALEADAMITEGTLISQQPYNYSGIDTSLEDKSMPVSLQDGGQDPKLSLEEPPSPPSKAEGSSSDMAFEADPMIKEGIPYNYPVIETN
uniref:increased DNA methylation 1-like n=1 Tax=Erigeron canadensis TaxID=72917 RepID=UPI001CB97852|nr:increased DNA methylation 1-like [Erigeron canadensis]